MLIVDPPKVLRGQESEWEEIAEINGNIVLGLRSQEDDQRNAADKSLVEKKKTEIHGICESRKQGQQGLRNDLMDIGHLGISTQTETTITIYTILYI